MDRLQLPLFHPNTVRPQIILDPRPQITLHQRHLQAISRPQPPGMMIMDPLLLPQSYPQPQMVTDLHYLLPVPQLSHHQL